MNEPVKQSVRRRDNNDKPYQDWWTVASDDVHSHMIQLIKTIDENQNERKYQDLRHGYLYQNRQGHDSIASYVNSSRGSVDRSAVTYNVVKSAIDTLTSKIGQNKPRPRILTEKGDYGQQQRAKNLSKYIDGVFAKTHTYRQGPQVFKDGAIFGTGALKVLINHETQQVETERVLIPEIIVDDLEGAYGDPKSMYQVRLVSRDILRQQFPNHLDKIEHAAPDEISNRKQKTVDLIKVYEGWHVGPDGKHVIAIDNCTLFAEDWGANYFPFAFFRYNTSISSFYGQGIAEELLGTQIEINKILRDIQRAQNLIAVPRIFTKSGSKVVTSHLNNEIGQIVKGLDKPDFFTPTAMNNEIYNHVKWLIQSAFEKVGLSQLSVASKKPGGLDSGRALREFKDTESERFASTMAQYEHFFEDVACLVIDMSKNLYKRGVDSKITAESREFIETINWSDVDIEDGKFVTRVQISSLLPTSPAARIQKVEELVRAGWISRESALQLLDFPDTEAWTTLETADNEYVAKIIADILSGKKYEPPVPELLPERAINYARKVYLEAKRNGAPEERVDDILRWIEAASALMPAPAQAPVVPESGTPTATPLPLPQTGLAPQV